MRQLRTASMIVYTTAAILVILDFCFPEWLSHSPKTSLFIWASLFVAILVIELLRYRTRKSFK